MIFTKYNNYKNSELNWVDSIPEDWCIDRIKNIGSVRARVGWKALKASEYVDKSEYIFLATPNIKNTEIDFLNVNYLTKERYEESPEIMLKKDDILLTKDGSTLGTVNIVKNLPSKTTVNSSIAVLRFKKDYGQFIFYQIKSEYIQNIVKLKKDGAGVPHLFQKDINEFKLFLPTKKIQIEIANYLDKQIKKINFEIELLEYKIEKYIELKQTLIHETVLRGLNKGIELNPSGIEWIGSIPNHWKVKRLKDISLDIFSGATPSTKIKEYWNRKDYIWLPSGELQNNIINRHHDNKYISKDGYNNCSTRLIKKNTVLIALTGATCANIGYLTFEATANQSVVAIINTSNRFISKFLYYYLITQRSYIKIYQTGGAQAGINTQDVKNLLITLPPLDEQIEIIKYLDEKTSKIDTIVETIEDKIKVLKEFKKTLINDVVTGKVKVEDE